MMGLMIATIKLRIDADMSEVIEISSRRISGTGVIQVPIQDAKYRVYTLFADIIRRPTTEYLSFEHEPPEGFYARISLMKDGYVVGTEQMRYAAQSWRFVADMSGQNLVAIKCAYLGLLQTFVNLGNALVLIPFVVDNTIEDYLPLGLPWDEIRVKCYKDCAIQFVLKATTYDLCQEDYADPTLPPTPPDKPETVPAGTGTEISPPYPDDDITDPIQLDDDYNPEPTTGNWLLTWTTGIGGTATGIYEGISTDVFSIVSGGSPTCTLAGNSALYKNTTELVEDQFNCNTTGFVSTLISQVFTPD